MLLALAGFAHATEVVVDDQDGSPHFTTTGNDWTTWSTLNYGFDSSDTEYHYTSHTVGGDDRRGTATWHPDLPVAGTWEVQTWFRATENRTPDADFIVTDGHGQRHERSLDQRGDGASGWVTLATVWCEEGFDSCPVTLDANDDDHSDEANAVRWVLVDEEEPDPEEDPGMDCETFAGLGEHTMTVFASWAEGAGWYDHEGAVGEPDGHHAGSDNVDAGEVLRAGGFPVCDPLGEERIVAVVLSVKGHTQYDSGPYEVLLRLDAAGSAAAVFNGTSAAWHDLDLSEGTDWTWPDLAALVGQVSLHAHPQGNRDSDAWVDAFRLAIRYVTTEGPDGPDEPGTDSADPEGSDTALDLRDTAWNGPPADGARQPLGGGCNTAPAGWLVWLAGILATAGRRRR